MTETALRPALTTMAPVPYRVASRVVENADSVTLRLEPEPESVGVAPPAPGQLKMG
jgi:hypothetical protein